MKRLMISGVVIAVLLLLIPAAVSATTVTVFLHSNNVELDRDLLSPYFIDLYQSGTGTYLGRFHSGMTILVNNPINVYCFAFTGDGIKGTASPPTPIGGADTELRVEYAEVTVNLHNGVDPLGPPTYYVEIQDPIGKKYHGDKIQVPVGSTFTYKACTQDTCGLLETGTSVSPALDYEYTKVTVQLSNGNTVLKTPDYYLDFTDLAQKKGTDEFIYVPEGAVVSFKPWTVTPLDVISGLTNSVSIGPAPAQTLDYEYATVKVHLFNEVGDLSWPYALKVTNVGTFANDDQFHVPPGIPIEYQAVVNSIEGPVESATFGAGDQTLEVEYATVHVELYGDTDPLWDQDIWFLEIIGINALPGHDQSFTVPAKAEFEYRARTGSIVGPVIKTSFDSGPRTLIYDYAEVTFIFDFVGGRCPMQTQVTGIAGSIANGGEINVPAGTDISFRAYVCGALSGMQIKQFGAGARTVTWYLTFSAT